MIVRRPLVAAPFAAWAVAFGALAATGALREGVPFLMLALFVLSPLPFAGVWRGGQESILHRWLVGSRVSRWTMLTGSVLARLSPALVAGAILVAVVVPMAPAGHLDATALFHLAASVLCICAWATALSMVVSGWANVGLLFFIEAGAMLVYPHLSSDGGQVAPFKTALVALIAPLLSAKLGNAWLKVGVPCVAAMVLFGATWFRVRRARI